MTVTAFPLKRWKKRGGLIQLFCDNPLQEEAEIMFFPT